MTVHAMAEIRPNEGDLDRVRDILLQMVEVTRKEDGNIKYDLYIAEDRKSFHIIEAWRDEVSLKAHMSTDSFTAALEELGYLVSEKPRTFRMSPVQSH